MGGDASKIKPKEAEESSATGESNKSPCTSSEGGAAAAVSAGQGGKYKDHGTAGERPTLGAAAGQDYKYQGYGAAGGDYFQHNGYGAGGQDNRNIGCGVSGEIPTAADHTGGRHKRGSDDAICPRGWTLMRPNKSQYPEGKCVCHDLSTTLPFKDPTCNFSSTDVTGILSSDMCKCEIKTKPVCAKGYDLKKDDATGVCKCITPALYVGNPPTCPFFAYLTANRCECMPGYP